MNPNEISVFFEKVITDTLESKLTWKRLPSISEYPQLNALMVGKNIAIVSHATTYIALTNNLELWLLHSPTPHSNEFTDYRFFIKDIADSDFSEIPLSGQLSGKLSTIVNQMVSQQESKVSSLISNYMGRKP